MRLVNPGSKCFRGDVTVKRNTLMDTTVLESEGDTEEDEDTNGTRLHIFHKF